jgi:hypothetical protein
MENQRVEMCDGYNGDTGGILWVFSSVSNSVFINVYEHNGNFVWHGPHGDFPVLPRCRHPSPPVGPRRCNSSSFKAPFTNCKRLLTNN